MKKVILMFLLCLSVTGLLAQDGITLEDMQDKYAAIYAAVVTAFTFASSFIPFLNRLQTIQRALIIGISIAVFFITSGFAAPLELTLAFLSQALVYDKVLKPVGLKVPKTKPQIIDK